MSVLWSTLKDEKSKAQRKNIKNVKSSMKKCSEFLGVENRCSQSSATVKTAENAPKSSFGVFLRKSVSGAQNCWICWFEWLKEEIRFFINRKPKVLPKSVSRKQKRMVSVKMLIGESIFSPKPKIRHFSTTSSAKSLKCSHKSTSWVSTFLLVSWRHFLVKLEVSGW